MWYYMNKSLNLVLVSEYPKCGATWFCNMLQEVIDLPFPRNDYPKLESCIMQGHYLYNRKFDKMIGVIRDGRDVMVSAYFYYLFDNEYHSLRHLFEDDLDFKDYNDVERNLPRFIEHLFSKYDQRPRGFSWAQAINSFYDNKQNVHIVKYENLLIQPGKELGQTAKFLGKEQKSSTILNSIAEKYSFKNLTKRKQGAEKKNTFLRKGIAGDWKTKFNREACEIFNYYAGDELIKAGYESDKNWF